MVAALAGGAAYAQALAKKRAPPVGPLAGKSGKAKKSDPRTSIDY